MCVCVCVDPDVSYALCKIFHEVREGSVIFCGLLDILILWATLFSPQGL